MPSIYKRNGTPFWFGAYRDERGMRRNRTTKTTERGKALEIVLSWEKTAAAARDGAMTADKWRSIIAEIHERTTGKPMRFHTVATWFDQWLKNIEGTAKAHTVKRYREISTRFQKWLGDRKKLALGAISSDDVRAFRDYLRTCGHSASNCNQTVKVLRLPFKQAQDEGLIHANPAKTVKAQAATGGRRQAFTLEQIRTLLTAAKDTDMEGLILLGAFCGLRLMDAARLKWGDVNLDAGHIETVSTKRGVPVFVPLHPSLCAWLKTRTRGIGKAPVLPDLAEKSGNGKSGVSQMFMRLMQKAGVVTEIARQGKGEGRTTHTLSFHSTRHFFVSALSAAGVAPDVRQRLAGHTDAKTHARYSAHEVQSLANAIAALPAV